MKRTDDDLVQPSLDLHFFRQMGFFQQGLGKTNAAGVSDLDQACFHNYIVITNTRSGQEGKDLQETEVYFDGGHHRHWFAVLHARLEAPLLHRFDGLLIQPEPQRAQHF